MSASSVPPTPPPRPRRLPTGGLRRPRRLLLVGLLVLVVFGLGLARGVAGFYTDYLWFDSLDLTSVFTGVLWAQVSLVVLFALFFAGLAWANLVIADRLAPRFRPPGPEEEALARLHAVMARRPGWVRAGIAIVLGVTFGAGVAGRWNEWILFRNAVDFGTADALFGRDVGFYVFQLPFLSFLTNWVFFAVVVVLVITTLAHYVNGGIRLQAPTVRVTPNVKAHLSVLLGVLALIKALNYYLDRFELVYSDRGVVQGATYTDVNAQLPALNLLIVISTLAGVLFFVNIRRQGWTLPVIAAGLWALVAVVAGTAYPALIQRFRVEPAESTREAPYIARNVAATQAAMGLADVRERPFAYNEDLTAADLAANAETVRNLRLWDPEVLQQTYQRLQEVRSYYRFTDVDVDRYRIDGDLTQIMLSARELNADSLPSESWENRHLAFTHGYGAVLSPANAVTSDGQPDFLVRNIPPQGQVEIDQPRLYFGEAIGGYSIVNSGRGEIDYLTEEGNAVENRYDGAGGVDAGSLLRRVAFALRFGDVNPVISNFMTGDSRILYIRDIRERAQKLAPFLSFDHDPYPVVLDGRITWLLDAYTTTNRYPYAESADVSRLPASSGLISDFNYVRNSVKVAIDAYDGNATFYVVDDNDPIAAAYAKAFPDLFTAGAEVPEELRAHFRYPEDLFRVQTNMWGRYHITDPEEFYSQSDRWNIAQSPASGGPAQATSVAVGPGGGAATAGGQRRMDPYYLLTRLPESTDTEFLILQPFVPYSPDDSRRELEAFMVASSDPEDYGQLEVFSMPNNQQVDGPAIISARINQDQEISQLLTLLSRAGSTVQLGNLVIVPIESSLLYVQPLYVQAEGANAVPELKNMIVAFGDRIEIRPTLQEALTAVFGDAPPTREEGPSEGGGGGAGGGGGGGGEPGGPTSAEVTRLLDDAATAFEAAQQALRDGDPVGYAQRIQEGIDLFNQARDAARAQGSSLPPPSTTLPPPPSTVPGEPSSSGAPSTPASAPVAPGGPGGS